MFGSLKTLLKTQTILTRLIREVAEILLRPAGAFRLTNRDYFYELALKVVLEYE